ncbi:MAG TPA: glycosyltransferase family 39 protein [Candidatus Eremiobacteraceae bacterium]
MALATFLVHVAGNPHYGFFRDELYFIICGRHPAWGYVDQPPIAPLLAAATQVFGPSLLLERAIPALFAAGAVYATCLLVAEFGGAAFAQILASLAVFFAPVLMNFGMKISTDTIGLLLWPLAALYLVRIVKGGDEKWWLGVGAIVGLGLESKYSILYFALALIAAVLCTPDRRVLWSKWFAAGIILAVLISLPNFVWQATHGFPIVELLRNGQNGKNIVVGPAEFVTQQFLITNVFLSIIWLLGLAYLLMTPSIRFLGIAYLILIAAMIASHAKHYYPADIYPILFAAGAVWIEKMTTKRTWVRAFVVAASVVAGLVFAPFAMPILTESEFVPYSNAVFSALHVNKASVATENQKFGALPQDWADMHGWPELAQKVASVYDGLPAADRLQAFAFTQNYGEAAAIQFFAPRVPVLSGHNQYWVWGARGFSGNVVLDVGGDCGASAHLFRSSVHAATFSAPYVMPYEDNLPIMICRGIKVPLATLWPTLKHYE